MREIQKSIDHAKVKQILVLELAGIGDAVLSTPTLKAIREKFKDAHITLVVISRAAELLKGSSFIDELIAWNIYYPSIAGILKRMALMKVIFATWALRQRRFDMVINLENISSFKGACKMALFYWFLGGKYRVGRDTRGRGFFLNVKVKDFDVLGTHEVEAKLSVAAALGCSVEKIACELPALEEEKKFISDFFRLLNVREGDVVIGLNPGAFRPSRRWFNERWARLADTLIETYGAKIVITGQNTEESLVLEIAGLMRHKEALTFTHLGLRQLCALIRRFTLFITNDSGPMHIAAALATPLVVLFGPGDVRRFSPYCNTPAYEVVRKEYDCKQRPCYRYRCDHRTCMGLITVEDILAAAKKVLKND